MATGSVRSVRSVSRAGPWSGQSRSGHWKGPCQAATSCDTNGRGWLRHLQPVVAPSEAGAYTTSAWSGHKSNFAFSCCAWSTLRSQEQHHSCSFAASSLSCKYLQICFKYKMQRILWYDTSEWSPTHLAAALIALKSSMPCFACVMAWHQKQLASWCLVGRDIPKFLLEKMSKVGPSSSSSEVE